MEDAEEYDHFVGLVREFLPECEQEILRQPGPGLQIAVFADRFESRYFPLSDYFKMGDVESYGELLRGIPVVVMGLSSEDYHYIADDWPAGLQLMTYLLGYPYVFFFEEEERGARIALADACARYVPRELLQRVPEGGLEREEVHRLLDGTPHEGLARWADILAADTDNFFLDVCDEELWGGEFPPWERQVVEHLTRDWAQAQVIHAKAMDLAEWLEEDPATRFGELLDFIEQRRREVNGEAQ